MTAQNSTSSAESNPTEASTPRPEQIGVAQAGEAPLKSPTECAADTKNEKDENAARDAAKKKRRLRRYKLQKMALKLLFPNLDEKLRDLSDGSDDPDIEDLIDSEDEKDTPRPAKSPEPVPEEEKPDIIHRAELYQYHNRYNRDRWTADLLHHVEDREPIQTKEGDSITKSSSVLEVTTMFAITERHFTIYNGEEITNKKFGQYTKPVLVRAKIRTYLTIRSPSLLQILQAVVTYYPVLANWRDTLVLEEPFCMLLHYQDELVKHRDSLSSKQTEKAEDDSTAYEHLTQLLDLLSNRHGADVKAETSRWHGNPAMCTFEWIWLLFRPGTKVIRLEDGVPSAYLVQWHNREVLLGEKAITEPPEFNEYRLDFSDPPKPLTVAMWCLDFDGRMIGRRRDEIVIQPFTGERKITSLPICPIDFWEDNMFDTGGLSIEASLIRSGEGFVELTKRTHCHYEGLTLEFPKQQINERVMIDSEHFYCNTPEGRDQAPKLGIPDSENYDGDDDGFRRSYYRRSATPSAYERASRCESSKSPYRSFDNIDPMKDELSELQLSLCMTKVWGFVLRNRTWKQLSVRCIKPPDFKTKLIDDLIIDEGLKKLIQSLAKSYTSGTRRWSADFIQDKGEGQILLLHGKPGVGKTTTAECVAELTGRPLLPLTCGDLGIEPLAVEANLMKWLKVGTRWEAIVLLDEAEVYLEAREITDLQRNSLVSIFLRALEYYKGILFLTTNRVGTFDDAFVSRIHLIVHYPDFSEEDREKIWHKFFSKLSKDRPNIRVDDGARSYAMKSEEVKELGWNGREIRNAFSTAVALAEDENQRDADDRIMLYEHHLKPVVEMSAKFKKKFKDIQGMSEEDLAKAKLLRSEASNEISQGRKHSIDSTIGGEIYDAAHRDGRFSKRLRTQPA